ncbi:MAG: PQQ-dependent sugar dehydrogenase [Pseudonocardia sp.]
MRRSLSTAACTAALALTTACGADAGRPDAGPGAGSAAAPAAFEAPVTGEIARDLEVPWGLAFLPGGDALVTERDSRRVLRVAPGGKVTPVGTVEDASGGGEGGLLGLAMSPNYATDRLVYVYFTTDSENRIERMTYDGTTLGPRQPVLTGIPAAAIHDGGALVFGPDGMLYAGTGDAAERSLAQDPASLGGKILRMTPEGAPAPGNPDPASVVYSLGHRNVQGLAFDSRGRLWASEFGANTVDELNLIRAGGNYGWPLVEGRGDRFEQPAAQWPTDEASPSGIAIVDDVVYMAGLRGERLWRIPVGGENAGEPTEALRGTYGRLRTPARAPDGSLWLTTSNRDGRGDERDGDDRILRLSTR